jgi:zinc/manganese transport system substrate-binding protein
MGRRLMIISAGATLLGAVLAGCGSSSGDPGAAPGTVPVVASTNVWASVVRAVGGDAVSVRSIIDDPSADPHSYEDKPENAAAVAEAKLVVANGGGYDEFFNGLVKASGTGAKQIVAFDLAGKGVSGVANEHVWYDLPTVKKVAGKVAEELGSLAPEKKATFTANATSFQGRLDELTAKLARIGRDRPGASVVFTEPVPQYLVEAAGLTNITPEEFSEAVEEETDPPAAAVAEVTGLVSDRKVAALLNNAQTETPVTNALRDAAVKAGVPVVDVTETLPPGVTGYLDWMTKQVDVLAAALART